MAARLYTANIPAQHRISIIDRTGAGNWTRHLTSPSAKGPRLSTSRPMARNSGPPARAMARSPSSISRSKRVTHTFNVQTKRSNRLRFTPDGKLVLISDLDAGDLLVLDRDTLNATLKRIKLGKQPAGILIHPMAPAPTSPSPATTTSP